MCGILAFAGEWDPERIQDIRRRGPDMLGAAIPEDGGWVVLRYRTPSWPSRIEIQSEILRARWGVLHARLTTSGDGSLDDSQPLLIGDDLVFAHNGTVYDHRKLMRRLDHETEPRTANDSEALAWLFEACGRDPLDTMTALARHQGETNHAWIAATPERMWIVAWGQPLWMKVGGGQCLVSSWRFEESELLPSSAVVDWRISSGRGDVACTSLYRPM